MARRRSRIKGSKSFRRLLKNVEPAIRAELVQALDEGGRELQRAMTAAAPRRSGALAGALKHKVLPRSLRLRVGLLTKAVNRKFFYARILEFGRKAQTVTVRNGPRKGRTMNIGAIAPKRFVYGNHADLRATMARKLKGIWERSLAKAVRGAGNE